MTLTAAATSLVPFYFMVGYLVLLVIIGLLSQVAFRGTSSDYFVASRSLGPFVLLMSVFGTTMTGFALVGSTGKTFQVGIGVYGLMASSSGLVHSLVFFLIGMRLWALGKRYGYVTQVQFFRDRFESPALAYLLFPILVALIVPYLLVGVIGACTTVQRVTTGMFPETFEATRGAIPPWVTGLAVCSVVLFYIWVGGVRSTAWVNVLQAIILMSTGVIAFALIARALGGPVAASEVVQQHAPERLAREGMLGKAEFISYMLVPLSVGMFPHLFQHWLTARSAKTFRLTVVAQPLFIGIVWLPCVLLGMWAVGQVAMGALTVANPNATLGAMVNTFVPSSLLGGLLTAGVLSAIIGSLDSQFVCLGTMFTNDVVARLVGPGRLSDRQLVLLARGFIVVIVAVAYGLSLALIDKPVFDLGVWCFSGFTGLFPVVFAALYWKRATAAGAIAAVLATAAVWCVLFFRVAEGGPAKTGAAGESLILGVMPVTFILAASTLAMIVVSLATRPPSPETVRRCMTPST